MSSDQVWILQVGCIVLFLGVSSVIVLALGVKAGEYLEARRVVKGELIRLAAAREYYQMKRDQRYKEALMAEMLENDFQKWEEFYAELDKHGSQNC